MQVIYKSNTVYVPHYSDASEHDWPWHFFHPLELSCKCCGQLAWHPPSMDMLQGVRFIMSVPLILNSAWRCYHHNLAEGGGQASEHRYAHAYDIRMTTMYARPRLVEACKQAGFTGFGYYENFLHVDTGRPRFWGNPQLWSDDQKEV